jgi:hypothetical protein
VLDWLEKTVLVFRSRLSQDQKITRLVNPQQFLGHLADGKLLARLAACLNTNGHIIGWDVSGCYAFFYKFAREKAKLAEGCVSFFLIPYYFKNINFRKNLIKENNRQ